MYASKTGSFADPTAIVSHFHLREGDHVADFGAGSGHYMRPLAHAVGKRGKVYLCEIQKNLVERLGIHIHEARLPMVHSLWCDVESPRGIKLQDESLDAGILSNTLSQFSDKHAALSEIGRVLRSGGKLFVIDWTDSFGGLGPRADLVVREIEAEQLLTSVGFVVERSFPAGDHHYGIACRKR